MKAVETHAQLRLSSEFNPGGEIAPSQVPPKSHCSPVTKLGTGSDDSAPHNTGPGGPLVPEEVVPQFDGLACSIGRDRMALH